MKKLSEVTKEDAIEIIKAGYEPFFNSNKWELKDDKEELREPCKTLHNKRKAWDFTFYEEKIHISSTTSIVYGEEHHDVKFPCYIKAWELGYNVPGMRKEYSLERTNSMNKPTDKYKHCNHHHEIGEAHELVDFGDGTFVANKEAIPLLKALNEVGLKTRSHHIDDKEDAWVCILLDDVRIEIREVFERDADRTKYNGKKELLIAWKKKSP